MSREIKFRAWDKFDKNMHRVSQLRFGEVSHDSMSIAVPDKNTWSESLILMQFTGLHDKNGKEIYEGDILEFDDCDTGIEGDAEEFTNQGFVEWENSIAAFVVSNRQEVSMEDFNWASCQVLGNVWENPELIK